MRALFVTPECAPLVKEGGLGDVSAALPEALRAANVDVRVLLPGYAEVLGKLGSVREVVRFRELGFDCRILEARSFLVVECAALYEREGTPYQDPGGHDWPDNPMRFALLSKAAARLAGMADVIHCNDWPAALVPFYTEKPVLLTIHNLAFQGNFDPSWLERLELPPEAFTTGQMEFHGLLSFLKGGLVRANAINTVSETYAREIQSEALGCGLDGVLRQRREALTGIVNGIDTQVWNPATDPYLAERYDADSLERKKENKSALQRRLNLEIRDDLPLAGFVGRVTHQKGVDLIAAAAAEIAAHPAQLAILGRGERGLEGALVAAAARHPGRIAMAIGFDEELAHLIEGGADFFLMPSRFEPCGLSQMYSQRYGTPPVARATGGLVDTIADGETGFLFQDNMMDAVRRACAAWREPGRWREMQRAAMRRDFSWAGAARRYADLYSRLASQRAR